MLEEGNDDDEQPRHTRPSIPRPARPRNAFSSIEAAGDGKPAQDTDLTEKCRSSKVGEMAGEAAIKYARKDWFQGRVLGRERRSRDPRLRGDGLGKIRQTSAETSCQKVSQDKEQLYGTRSTGHSATSRRRRGGGSGT